MRNVEPQWSVSVKADDATDAEPALSAALDVLDRAVGGIVDIPPGKYYVARPVVIPSDFAVGACVVIRGFGAQIRTDQNIPIISRVPPDQATALNQMVGLVPVVEGVQFKGSGLSGQVGLSFGPSYGARVTGCRFVSLGTGIDLQFALNARVEGCLATNCTQYGFVARYGTWTGATNFNSQSNHTTFANCRVYNADATRAGFYVLGSSGVVLDSCISEGSNPEYNVKFDCDGSTVTKTFFVRNLHVENSPTRAHVYVNAAQVVDIDGVFYQSGNVLVELGNDQHWLTLKNVPWIPASSVTPFKAINTGGRHHFENVGARTWTDASNWVGGIVPSALTIT